MYGVKNEKETGKDKVRFGRPAALDYGDVLLCLADNFVFL
jgi:hypothetical protein